jgi:arabinoxylan arabinofuranohydrolase
VAGRTVSAPVGADGSAVLALAKGSLAPGVSTLTVSYGGTAEYAASSGTARVSVSKARAAVRVSGPGKVKAGKALTVQARVSAAGVTPTGKVTVSLAGVKVKAKTVSVKNGTVSVKLRVPKATKPGAKKLRVAYGGSSYVAAASATRTIRVTR